jgi:HAL2 family 3'(2'),5'-bisphosphate nucleotidase
MLELAWVDPRPMTHASSDPLPVRLAHAELAVAAAMRATRAVHASAEPLGSIDKEDRSPVTIADFAAQAIVAISLQESEGPAPIRLVGEEQADLLKGDAGRPLLQEVTGIVRLVRPGIAAGAVLDAIAAGACEPSRDGFWTLDPIDGTKGFLRRQQYAIALAWVEGGVPQVGVLGCPHLSADSRGAVEIADPVGSLFSASRGGGAWSIDPRRLDAPRSRIESAAWTPGDPVVACESVESGHSRQDRSVAVLASIGPAGPPIRLDSQCKYAVVARGQAHAYLRLPTRGTYIERIWDHAAGVVIAEEAGAVVSDCEGRPLDFGHGRGLERNRGVVAASARLHARLIEAIAATAQNAAG